MLTPDLLTAATGCTPARAQLWAAPLAEACAPRGITTPARLAAFIAHIGHESGSLQFVCELWGPTPQQLRYERDPSAPWPADAVQARQPAFERNRLAYFLGNTEPGDGKRYCGRGPIQNTGRFNARRLTQRLREQLGPSVPDFEADPQQLENPRWGAHAAADYWDERRLNELAEIGTEKAFEQITRAINGGLNGLEDRQRRWEKAKAVLMAAKVEAPAPAPAPVAPPEQDQTEYQALETAAAGDPAEYPQPEATMPLPAIAAALLPTLIEAIPKLGKLFGTGSAVAERNVAAAELALKVVQDATGTRNAQEAVETIKADPAAQQIAAKAIEARWLDLSESGGGGIDGARKADTAASAAGGLLHSPSFWIACLLLPLVYLLVLSLIGLVGTATWSDDVRAGLAGSLISAVIGGLVGYYYGQTTTRNRTPV